jgi:hypothetical protein
MLRFDHVILCVQDFAAASARLRREHGLVAMPGGVHPFGSRNWSVALEPPQYLELLGVDDRDVLARSPFGLWLLGEIERGDHLVGWAVSTDDIDAVAARTGRRPVEGSIVEREGEFRGAWRDVFPPGMLASGLPFFIQYPEPFEQRVATWRESYEAAASPAAPGEIAHIVCTGDVEAMRAWLDEPMPITVTAGPPGMKAVHIAARDGEIVLS